MDKLIVGVSGVRGIVNKTLTEEVAWKMGKAFATLIYQKSRKKKMKIGKPKIGVAQDKRETSKEIKEAFIKGILSTGSNVVDMKTLSTPAALYNVSKIKLKAGVVITASHNPKEWNGFKFIKEKGKFFDKEEMEEVYQIYKEGSFWRSKKGKIVEDLMGSSRRSRGIMDSIGRNEIREKEFKIVIDSPWVEEYLPILTELKCTVVPVDLENLTEEKRLKIISKEIIKNTAHIGFVTDSDGDRVKIVTEKGEMLSSEYTLPLVGSWALTYRKGIVVTNLSTSKMIEDVVNANNCELIRTKVGETNVVEEMIKKGAILGGEGNGGIIDPYIHYTRDSLIGICRILEYMANTDTKISELANRLPKYYMIKESLPLEECKNDLPILKKLFKGVSFNEKDGIRFNFTHGWLHVRKSNTEPIVRVICETTELKESEELIQKVIKKLKN
jgi:phosphomannomutase